MRVKNFHLSMLFILASTQPPIRGTGGPISRGTSGKGMKLTTQRQLVPRLSKRGLYIHTPMRLHGVVLRELSTGTTLTFICDARVGNARSHSDVIG
jgi:hypothetical protein